MKYDGIVIGGGPGGLMAAKTAAMNGLKVALIERRNDITAPTRRTDNPLSYFNFLTPEVYMEPIMVEVGTGVRQVEGSRPRAKTKISFPVPGFSIDYTGPLVFYYNYINASPAGYQVYGMKDELWGFNFSREIMLADLLSAVEKTGVDILTGTLAIGAENIKGGVTIRVRGKSGEQTLEARKAIVADGINSKIVDSLGFNKDRPILSYGKSMGYVLEGVEVEAGFQDHCSWLSFNIPSLNPSGIMLAFYSESGVMNMKQLLGDPEEALKGFMKHKRYASWFRNARLVRKTAAHIPQRAPLKEVAAGNVIFVGDTVNMSGIMGAIASGYQSVKAILKELNDQEGYPEYKAWYYNAFAAFTCQEHDRLRIMHRIFRKLCTDDDVDHIYKTLQGEVCHPAFVVFENPELVRDRPELYEKVIDTIKKVENMTLTF
jgi:flavin-dependent dehydrogenase